MQTQSNVIVCTKSATDIHSNERCFVYGYQLSLQKMRTHIGWHEVNGQLGKLLHPCGYCGRDICQSKLEVKSKKKWVPFYKINSNWPYFVELARKPSKGNRINPCSNYLEKCKFCSQDVWKYNLIRHYSQVHQDVELPAIDELYNTRHYNSANVYFLILLCLWYVIYKKSIFFKFIDQ